MKRSLRPRLTLLPAAVLLLAGLSSCNRGYGCPTNFSLNESLVDVVTLVISLF